MSESNAIIRDWVAAYFGERSGTLWEFGAFDGVNDSITRPLLTRDANRWSGLMVEGNCSNAAKLQAAYADYANVKCLHAVLALDSTPIAWWDDDGDQESTICDSHLPSGLSHPRGDGQKRVYTRRLVAPLTLRSLWAWKAGVPPDLLVIDLEGFTEPAAEDLHRLGCRPEMIVAETRRPDLLPGYKTIFRHSIDTVFVKS